MNKKNNSIIASYVILWILLLAQITFAETEGVVDISNFDLCLESDRDEFLEQAVSSSTTIQPTISEQIYSEENIVASQTIIDYFGSFANCNREEDYYSENEQKLVEKLASQDIGAVNENKGIFVKYAESKGAIFKDEILGDFEEYDEKTGTFVTSGGSSSRFTIESLASLSKEGATNFNILGEGALVYEINEYKQKIKIKNAETATIEGISKLVGKTEISAEIAGESKDYNCERCRMSINKDGSLSVIVYGSEYVLPSGDTLTYGDVTVYDNHYLFGGGSKFKEMKKETGSYATAAYTVELDEIEVSQPTDYYFSKWSDCPKESERSCIARNKEIELLNIIPKDNNKITITSRYSTEMEGLIMVDNILDESRVDIKWEGKEPIVEGTKFLGFSPVSATAQITNKGFSLSPTKYPSALPPILRKVQSNGEQCFQAVTNGLQNVEHSMLCKEDIDETISLIANAYHQNYQESIEENMVGSITGSNSLFFFLVDPKGDYRLTPAEATILLGKFGERAWWSGTEEEKQAAIDYSKKLAEYINQDYSQASLMAVALLQGVTNKDALALIKRSEQAGGYPIRPPIISNCIDFVNLGICPALKVASKLVDEEILEEQYKKVYYSESISGYKIAHFLEKKAGWRNIIFGGATGEEKISNEFPDAIHIKSFDKRSGVIACLEKLNNFAGGVATVVGDIHTSLVGREPGSNKLILIENHYQESAIPLDTRSRAITATLLSETKRDLVLTIPKEAVIECQKAV